MPARLLVGDDAAGKEVVPCRREVEATAVVVAGFLEVKTPGLVVQVGRKTKRRAGRPARKKIHMKRSNVNPCPHVEANAHTIRTSDGRTAILCPACLTDLESRLADPLLIQSMIKSTMTTAEVQKMRYERDNMALERQLSEKMSAVWAVAGYPRRPALAAPGV